MYPLAPGLASVSGAPAVGARGAPGGSSARAVTGGSIPTRWPAYESVNIARRQRDVLDADGKRWISWLLDESLQPGEAAAVLDVLAA